MLVALLYPLSYGMRDGSTHDADARGGAKSKHHPFLTRKDPFFNAQRFQNIVATYALGRATDLQPISGLLVLAVFIDAKIRVFLLRVLMRYCCFFFAFVFVASPNNLRVARSTCMLVCIIITCT